MLHLIYRLVVQPNTSRAHLFAEAFITGGGVETLLVLLQKEAKAGDHSFVESPIESSGGVVAERLKPDFRDGSHDDKTTVLDENHSDPSTINTNNSQNIVAIRPKIERMSSVSETSYSRNLGGITFSISADNARNNVYNIDKSDGVVVAIIGLVGALFSMGHLKFCSPAPPDIANSLFSDELNDGGSSMFHDKVSLVLFALQKAIQAAPNRLMSNNVYTALLSGSV